MNEIRIVPIDFAHIPGFRAAVGEVARERKYLLAEDAFAVVTTATFVAENIAQGQPQYVALEGDEVVGWCDIRRGSFASIAHRGTLGLGLRAPWRGRGLGRALMQATMDAGWRAGLTRIELTVRASNTRAIALYERMGFEHEGRMREAIRIDGEYDDLLMMALRAGRAQGDAP